MNIRNLAIIAHVDHGKTTLVDQLLQQSGIFRANQKMVERAMDSNDLEREKGITILAKCTSISWQNIKLNIVDTPGHADFGGEVERILGMVDGVILLVDAAEGPMPQTKFVTIKALNQGLRPIVVINKIDRPDARPDEVHNMVFDLFVALGANDAQLDFPTLFASGKQGWAVKNLEDKKENMTPLFDAIIQHVPQAQSKPQEPFALLTTILEYDPYLGRVLTGRVQQGTAKVNMTVKSLNPEGQIIEQGRLTKLLSFRGLDRIPIETAEAGDIVAIAGLEKTTVADTICDIAIDQPIPSEPIDPPTLAMTFAVNDSPFSGRDGDKLTTRMIRSRLLREAEGNVAIQVRESESKDSFEVSGRGELQLGVLIETMRREGFELSISRPRVLYKKDPETGQNLEPMEEIQIDVDEEFVGVVVEKIGGRRGELQNMAPSGAGKTRLNFIIPSRGLIGYHGEFLTDTRGTGIMNRLFHGYAPYKGSIEGRHNGVLIANATGASVAYALWYLEERGWLMIAPGMEVYEGMIIGEHSRDNDLEVNPLKQKQLTNIRTTSKDEAIRLTPPKLMTLEQALAYINDDELVEVTPKNIRLRKKILDPHDRKRASRAAEKDGGMLYASAE
ncbi:MAG: translational GTPase TypA [Alphaproteobacteria bacterium]|nr:translational GTPase TypA [Alphaproteobacteria bacterium]